MISHSKPWLTDRDQAAVREALGSGMIAQGQRVQLFEEACARYLGISAGVAVGSGTAALILALLALDLRQGSEVILPTYVCRSVAEAVISAGYVPVLCDVGDGWNMTSETVAKALTRQTTAIILVHLFGIPADVEEFSAFGLPIVEDTCQAFGAKIGDRMAGTMGTVGIFSFHATKCLTTGEGGLAVSNDSVLLRRMQMLRDGEGRLARRVVAPMTDLQAALGLSQLSRYDLFLERRRVLAERYFEALENCHIELPHGERKRSIFFRFPVREGGDFGETRQKFSERDIQVRQGVDVLLHRLIDRGRGSFPTSERLFAEAVSLPIYPALMDEEQERIIQACRDIWGVRCES
jgi:UDP-4-amino-4-deoxy-L-arabinose-oxoglutarate aminotransferase